MSRFDIWSLIITAASALASFFMVFITWRSLVQNRKEMSMLKKQWKDEHKANVVFKIKYTGYGIYRLVMENVGKETASGISFSLDSLFLDSILLPSLKAYLSEISEKQYQLLPGERISFEFAYQETNHYDGFLIKNTHCSYEDLKANFASMSSTDCHISGKYNNESIIDQTVGLSGHYIECLSTEEHLSLIYSEMAHIRATLQPSSCGDTIHTEISKLRTAIEQKNK